MRDAGKGQMDVVGGSEVVGLGMNGGWGERRGGSERRTEDVWTVGVAYARVASYSLEH